MTAVFVILLTLSLTVPPVVVIHDGEYSLYRSATIPLDTYVYLNRWWLQSMNIVLEADNVCNGRVAVIKDKNCPELPLNEENVSSISGFFRRFALPGSSFNVTLPNNTLVRSNLPHIWFAHTLEAIQKLSNQIRGESVEYSCNKTYSDATCFSALDNLGSNVVFDVKQPGYYSSLVTTSDDSSLIYPGPPTYGIELSYNIFTYNVGAIKDYAVLDAWKEFSGNEMVTLTVSHPFNFSNRNCALFYFECPRTSTGIYKFSIGHLLRRWDIPVLTIILYLIIVCIIALIFLFVYTYSKIHDRLDNIIEVELH